MISKYIIGSIIAIIISLFLFTYLYWKYNNMTFIDAFNYSTDVQTLVGIGFYDKPPSNLIRNLTSIQSIIAYTLTVIIIGYIFQRYVPRFN
jgi:hypothetical protein